MSGAGAGGGELAQFGSASPAPTPPAPTPTAPSPATAYPVRNRGSLAKAIVYAVLAVFAGIASGFMLRAGISSDNFPPFLAGEEFSTITKYSGPWLTAAAGAALLAGLLLLATAFRLTRWLRGSQRNDDARA